MSRSLKLSFSALVVVSAASLVWAQAPPQPTEQHKAIAQEEGVWKAEMKMWIEPGQQEPIISVATETNTQMGPFWMLSEFKADFGGVEFVGHGQSGYDPVAKKYVGTWIDSMNPYLSTLEGDYDAETKTLTMVSTARDPQTGKMAKNTMVTKFVDENGKVFTMYKGAPGDEDRWKMVEIAYQRAK